MKGNNVVNLAPSSLQDPSLQYSLYPNGKVSVRQKFKVMQVMQWILTKVMH